MRYRIFLLLLGVPLIALAAQGNVRVENSSTDNMINDTSKYSRLLQKADALLKKGQPRSAADFVEQAYDLAKEQQDAPRLILANIYQMRILSDYEEDYLLKSIEKLQEEVREIQAPGKQILHSMLAEMYWAYYQQNRYKILDRTQILEGSGEDIESWSAGQFINTVVQNYQASLENEDLLKNTDINSINLILSEYDSSDIYRPTLFDFLAHRAIDYYMNEESGLNKPAVTFQIDDKKYFAPADDFSKTELQTSDSLSLKFHALSLLQELVKFHLEDKEPSALIDVDLKRLVFVQRNAEGVAGKDSLYLQALQYLKTSYKDTPAVAEVYFRLAQKHRELGSRYIPYEDTLHRYDLKKAVGLCEEAIQLYPDSRGAHNCMVLMQQIREPLVSLNTAAVEVPGEPILGLFTWKNSRSNSFKIIKTSEEEYRELSRTNRGEQLIRKYAARKAYKSFSVNVPETNDLQEHSAQIEIPELEPGFYVILITTEQSMLSSNSEKTLPDAITELQVSQISYISSLDKEGGTEFYVLDRQSGKPLQDVKARVFRYEYDYRKKDYSTDLVTELSSDKNGYFRISKDMAGNKNFRIQFINQKDSLYSPDGFYARGGGDRDEMRERTYFFTDRAIYRPGQTVYFKGIMIRTNGKDHELLTKKETKVTFYDVNGQQISTLNLQTSDYGSFNGSFIIPTGLLTGQMRIANSSGSKYFNVEEYKRPKFEVSFEPPSGSYKLNEDVSVQGTAISYAGVPVDNAEVKYRVVRNVRLPYWPWWRGGFYPQRSQTEIKSGTATTNASGEFNIEFTAVPDLSINQYKPVFDYTVYADVTDLNGETRSAETRVSVSKTALLLKTSLEEKINKKELDKFKIIATNLSGESVAAMGDLEIFKLRQPERIYRERLWQRPDLFLMEKEKFHDLFPHDLYNNEDSPTEWEKADKVLDRDFNTSQDSIIQLPEAGSWKNGIYLVVLNSEDEFGEKVESREYFSLWSENARDIPVNDVLWHTAARKTYEPGETAEIFFGTAADNIYAVYDLQTPEGDEKQEILKLSEEQETIQIPVKESYRGNIAAHIAFVKFNRFYSAGVNLNIPFTNKQLDISLETFRDKMKPGSEEEWRVKISGKNAEKVSAEFLASMYDASLDAFVPHNWNFEVYQSNYSPNPWYGGMNFRSSTSQYYADREGPSGIRFQQYDRLNWHGFRFGGYMQRDMMMKSATGVQFEMVEEEVMEEVVEVDAEVTKQAEVPPGKGEDKPAQTEQMQIRRNFNETVFFYPALQTNEEGEIIFSFTMPDALTRWKFMGLAHTQDLKTGSITKEVVTQKKLMLMPNVPRFVRVGDTLFFTTKITSLSDSSLAGTATLQFFNALNMQAIDAELQLTDSQKSIEVAAGKSASVSWKIIIPEGLQAITYRLSARAGNFTDAEEKAIPVLPNRMLVTESLSLPVRANETKQFRFEKLINSHDAPSLRNYQLTLEYTSNPAWYAVQALPYLMEYPYECSEQVYNRYYANALAAYIANSNPRIKRVFDAWRDLSPDAFLSNLEKNEELKSVLLEETPWVREAKNESERKKRIALLFDLNKLAQEQEEALAKLQQMQLASGAWPWFKGMRENRHITQYIVSGLAHLRNMGVNDFQDNPQTWKMLKNAIGFMDNEIRDDYEKLKERNDSLQKDHLNPWQIQYLYARSYFMDELPVGNANREAFNYYKQQASEYWFEKNNYMQGMIALALNRFGNKSTPSQILTSLKERSLHSEELGMYWRSENGWYWYQSEIEQQALLIEAFEEIARDAESVNEMQVWLLKQKQTQNWKSTKATADAIYALLIRGTDILADDESVIITLGDKRIDPVSEGEELPEAGTGYFKKTWSGNEIEASMGEVRVENPNRHIAWGALYWQYFQDLDKITAHKGPLSVEKKLYREKISERGPVIEAIEKHTKLSTGDKIIVRITIKTDRDMEYVHLKDMRAAGFEPASVLSGYKRKGGIGYYESIRDASTNFFIDYLQKGSYVFEYPLIVSQEGQFSNGITSIQCMYAPEFVSHSEGVRVEIK